MFNTLFIGDGDLVHSAGGLVLKMLFALMSKQPRGAETDCFFMARKFYVFPKFLNRYLITFSLFLINPIGYPVGPGKNAFSVTEWTNPKAYHTA